MKRKLQGHYFTISTVGEKVRAFVPSILPPKPPIEWEPDLRSKFDEAHLALGRLDSISTFLPDISLFLNMYVRLNGNGRLGRLLITLLLCEQKILRKPILYLSLYFKTHRQNYYKLLNEVRLSGNWEAWFDFFAEVVIATATQAVDTARQLIDLANKDRVHISGLGRAAVSTLQVHRALMRRPVATSGWLVEKTDITPATVNKCLGHLVQLGIVEELTSRKRNRVFRYTGYLDIINQGTELPPDSVWVSRTNINFAEQNL